MSDTVSTTKEVLKFVGARMDSLAPVLKKAVNGVADASAHYGTEWVRYRAWEIIGQFLFLLFFVAIAGVASVLSYQFGKGAVKAGKENRTVDGYVAGTVISAIIALAFIIVVGVTGYDIFPKALAAMTHPDGLAVQLLIDGIKGN